MTCPRNRTDLDSSPDTGVEDIYIARVHFRSRDWRCTLASRYLQLQSASTEDDILSFIKLRIRSAPLANGIGAFAQASGWKCIGSKVEGLRMGEFLRPVDYPHTA